MTTTVSIPVIGLLFTCAAPSAGRPGPEECAGLKVGLEWTESVSRWVGAGVMLPSTYAVRNFDFATDSSRPRLVVEPRRRTGVITIALVDSAVRYVDSALTETRCQLRTRSGMAPAVLRKLYRRPGEESMRPLFTVQVRLKPADPRDSDKVVIFSGSADDSATFIDHLAIASSMRVFRRP